MKAGECKCGNVRENNGKAKKGILLFFYFGSGEVKEEE